MGQAKFNHLFSLSFQFLLAKSGSRKISALRLRANKIISNPQTPKSSSPSSAIAMANMPVSEMRLPPHLAHLLAARRLDTAKVSPSCPRRLRTSLLQNPHLP
jgi:hypothetical protein